jgi:hypothetical protein
MRPVKYASTFRDMNASSTSSNAFLVRLREESMMMTFRNPTSEHARFANAVLPMPGGPLTIAHLCWRLGVFQDCNHVVRDIAAYSAPMICLMVLGLYLSTSNIPGTKIRDPDMEIYMHKKNVT